MGRPPKLRLTEIRPGRYRTWWSVPPDVDPGRYIIRGKVTQADVERAVQPLGEVVIRPQARGTFVEPFLPPPPTAPPPPPPPPGAGAPPGGVAGAPAAGTALALDFVHQGLRPDLPVWVTPDDVLLVGVRSSMTGLTLRAAARLWTLQTPAGGDPDSPFPTFSPISQQLPEAFGGQTVSITPPNDRSLNFTSIPLAYGYLVGATVQAAVGSPTRGQCLASIYLARAQGGGNVIYRQLAQDYVTAMQGPSWPDGRIVSGLEGPGLLRNIVISNPPAGQDPSQAVPTGARWRVRGMQGRFHSTSAPNPTEDPRFQVVDTGPNVVTLAGGGYGIVATQFSFMVWFPGATLLQNIASQQEYTTPLPIDCVVLGGWTVRIQTASIQAADTWDSVTLFVEELLEG